MSESKIVFLPGLNGIRAIAAIGVMLSHTNAAMSSLNKDWSLFGLDKEGNVKGWVLAEHGVTMFFVLSGFLITFLLLKEKEKIHTINVKSFYMRRVLRIWPLYYLYFFFNLFLMWYLGNNFEFSTVSFYLFFAANIPFIFNKALLNLDHFWSIGVEEQFYLFWPWLFKKIEKGLKTILVFIALVLALFRIFIWYYKPFSVVALFSVVNRFDCMILGGLVAIFYIKRNFYFMKVINNKWTQFFALLVFFLLFINKFWFLNSIIEIFVVAVATAVVIIGQIEIKNRIINFNNWVMDYLGKLSYGIYVIHPLIIFSVVSFIKFEKEIYLNPILYFIAIGLITIGFSHFSYQYFELPFLKLKSKYSIIKSRASANN